MGHQMTVLYEGGLRTRGEHLASGEKIVSDAPVDNQGRGEAYSPTDLLSSSLASCALTIMGILAERKGWKIEGTTAEVRKVMATDPRRVAEIHITIFVRGDFSQEKERKMLEEAARSCPVARSLHPDLKQVMKFLYED